MPGITPRYTPGHAITYPVSAVVAGGQFVDADQTASTDNSAATVTPSAAGSLLWVGVAIRDAAPAGTDSATDAAARPPHTGVVGTGNVVPVTFAAASEYGDRLKTAAAGTVTPWVDGTDDPAAICGTNADTGGAVAEGAVGLVKIA